MTTYGVKWSQDRCYKQDPLLDILPALLNSQDVKRYVDEGCLLEKGEFDRARMKPASYEMRFLGKLYDWQDVDGRLEKRCREVREGDVVELGRNSISYLWIEEHLRLPEYIAARFNLRISEVHKGLLLGTGPLIDPGFGGRILIPLHNLTDKDYKLTGGDGIIWIEFTKLSLNAYWGAGGENTKRPSDLVRFPSEKAIDDPHHYFLKADAIGGVQSAFKGALVSARASAEESKNSVKGIKRRVTYTTVIGLLSILLGLAALVFSAFEISGQVADRVHRQGERIGELEINLEEVKALLSRVGVVPATENGEQGETTGSRNGQPVEADRLGAGVEESPVSTTTD